MPKSPNRIEGIPERVSVAYSISDTSLPGFAYSLRYIAPPMLTGVAMSIVIRIISSVFTILPAIPEVPFNTLVTVVRKDQFTDPIPLTITYTIMPNSNATERATHM